MRTPRTEATKRTIRPSTAMSCRGMATTICFWQYKAPSVTWGRPVLLQINIPECAQMSLLGKPMRVSEWNDQPRISNHSKAIFAPILNRPLPKSLHTTLQIVATAVGNLFPRIRDNLREPCPQLAVCLSPYCEDRSQENPEIENSFLCASMSHIQQLSTENQFLDGLDLQIASRSYRAGAISASRNVCSESNKYGQLMP